MDPFSLATGIAGLLSLAGTVAQMTFGFISDIKSYPEEFTKLVMGTREMCGILCTIKPAIDRVHVARTISMGAELISGTVVKAEQLEACSQTLRKIMDLLDNTRRHKNGSVRKVVDRVDWAIKKKDQAKTLLEELERHKSTFDLAFSADVWYNHRSRLSWILTIIGNCQLQRARQLPLNVKLLRMIGSVGRTNGNVDIQVAFG
jgi:hypothetical protein